MPNRNDLARRCIVLNLEPFEGQILEEKRLIEHFRQEALPEILGALCDAVSAALRNEQMILKDLPCMASFTAWVLRAEEVLPWQPGAFKQAYMENTQNIIEQAVDADLVSSVVQEFMTGREYWEGTASELLEELCEIIPEKTQKQKAWPKLPHILSGRLRRAANFLGRVGIQVEMNRNKDMRSITLFREGVKKSVTSVTASPNEDKLSKLQQKFDDASGDASSDSIEKSVTHQVSENIEENAKGDACDADDAKKPTQSKDECEHISDEEIEL
jgi:hypothetical protein